ncbi:MAG: Type 1 glutamine amidotransferase-like domain-containing protein [Patescibacteria group bacterium]
MIFSGKIEAVKLYLFGGAETDQGQGPILKEMINDVLADVKPKQLLHIPYARIIVPEGEEDIWGEGWVAKDLKLDGIMLLDARNEDDLARADNPVIFMNGGPQRDNLYDNIVQNKKLHDLVMNAEVVIGESAGSMVCAEYRRTYKDNVEITKKGLGILSSTIIEPHYSERNRHQLLRDEMKEVNAKYGIGIDSISGIIIDTKIYPDEHQTVGSGLVELVKREDL